MPRNLQILLVVAVLIIVGAIAALFLLSGDDGGENNTQPNQVAGTPGSSGATTEPDETATPLPPTQELTQILIAVQRIERGSVIPPDAVALRPWPLEAAPFNVIRSAEEVIGRRARTDIFVEQPIIAEMVVDNLADLADVGSDAAAIIPEGFYGISVPMDRITSVAYAIQPGDRVDIVVSLLYVDLDEEFQSILPNNINLVNFEIGEDGISISTGLDLNGRFESVQIPLTAYDATTLTTRTLPVDWPVLVRPSENPRPRLITQRTVQDALVIHVGDFPADGRLFEDVPTPTPIPVEDDTQQQQGQNVPPPPTPEPPRPDIVTLAVSAQEAVMLTYLIESRVPLTFLLRAASDTSGVITDAVTLEYIMGEYDITVPPPTTFSIQPAIRSIRQLVAGNRITLDN